MPSQIHQKFFNNRKANLGLKILKKMCFFLMTKNNKNKTQQSFEYRCVAQVRNDR